MTEQYQETEMSKRAREIIKEMAHPGSPMEVILNSLVYDKRFRQRIDGPDGIDLKKAYNMIGVEDQEIVLLKRCIEWNLTEEEVHKIIKYRYRICYDPENDPNQYGEFGGMNLTMVNYPKWCEFFGINPDPEFPDWGDKEEAKRTTERDKKIIKDTLEEQILKLKR